MSKKRIHQPSDHRMAEIERFYHNLHRSLCYLHCKDLQKKEGWEPNTEKGRNDKNKIMLSHSRIAYDSSRVVTHTLTTTVVRTENQRSKLKDQRSKWKVNSRWSIAQSGRSPQLHLSFDPAIGAFLPAHY